MRSLKLTLSYDGSNFFGWQRQSNGRTVEAQLLEGLKKMHKKEIPLLGSGRTDSGVHALGQVIKIDTELDSIPLESFPKALNSFLPSDILIHCAEEVSAEFHPRFDAIKRSYKYYLVLDAYQQPWDRNYSWHIGRQVSLPYLNELAAAFIGQHDFSAFSSPNEQVPNRVRTVYSSSFYFEGNFLIYEISANAFLWKMVRSILGSIFEYEQKGYGSSDVKKFLQAKDRSFSGPTAPPQGLFLFKVEYPDNL